MHVASALRALAVCNALLAAGCAGERISIAQSADSPNPPHAPLTAYLYMPDGARPHPTVILLHGCSGLELETAHRATWKILNSQALRYVDRGYAALILDSYSGRGHQNLCDSNMLLPFEFRAWDAAAAARHLIGLGVAKPGQIVVQGMSAGGGSALEAAKRNGPGAMFAAAIAWYPKCEASAFTGGFAAPVLILAGGADEWTTALECQVRIGRLTEDAIPTSEIVFKVYPGATHAYDYPVVPRIYWGHFMTFDGDATRRSWAEVDAFLARHVR